MDDITTLKKWVENSQGNRTVEIKIGNTNDSSFMQIWAYDYSLQEGQFVKSAKEINIEGKKENHEKKFYEKLKLKYEVKV